MGEGSGTTDAGSGGWLPQGFGGGTFHETALYSALCDQRHWSVPAALAAGGAAVLLSALMVRFLIYLIIRLTGQNMYTKGWQSFETILLIAMFVGGGILGYIIFGNLVSSALCGVCFGFLSLGVALQALTANEQKRFN